MQQQQPSTKRECGMLVTVAAQGTGKTHQNKITICEYVKDKLSTKVPGRKVLILDTNGEYGPESFGINGIPPLAVKKLAVKDVHAWSLSKVVDARRIDMKSLPIDDKLAILNYVCLTARNCMVVMEDINTIILDITHMKDIVSSIVNLRHKGVDVIVSYQSLRAVEPRILSNCRYVRMHYMIGDVDDVKGKLSEPDVFKIAQILVNQKYFSGNERFFLYVHTNPPKIKGSFTEEDFLNATKKFLQLNKKKLKQEVEFEGGTMDQAMITKSKQYLSQFYGNAKQPS